MTNTGIDLTENGGSGFYLFGPPPEIVDVLRAEADERDDPLLKMWVRGQDAERRNHSYYDEHKSWDGFASQDLVEPHMLRRQAVDEYAFSVTHRHALTRVAEFVGELGLLSLGAGTGWWEHRLAIETGLDVLAYDLYPPGHKDNHWYADAEAFHEVLEGDVPVAGEHPDRVLFLAWPPYGEPFAMRALTEYEQAGGKRLIYVGEGAGGCTADDDFFHAVSLHYEDEDEQPPKRWMTTAEIAVPQWFGLHDAIWCLERVG